MPNTSSTDWASPLDRGDLERLAGNYRIFVDTCSLMDGSAEAFFYKTFPPILLAKQARLIIAEGVLKEIRKHQSSPKLRENANTAHQIITSYLDKGLAERRGESDDPFVDSLFLTLFQKFRTTTNLALITQDTALAEEINQLNSSRAVRSKYRVDAFRITRGGLLAFQSLPPSNTRVRSPTATRQAYPNSSAAEQPLFRTYSSVASVKDTVLNVKDLPEGGTTITDSNSRPVTLTAPLAKGGEGTIYATSIPDRVAKIYIRERLTQNRQQKVELMVNNQISVPGICWPEAVLYNQHRQFVGYLMRKATGAPIQQRLFIRPIFQRTYPLWTRANLLRFTNGVLEKIKVLNDQNVIIGDINPNNILTDGENSYFVDTDSYQIDGYPCPVGTINFTAPEIQRKEFQTFLRTQEHENFAIATLVFMLLLPGKPPYSHQGGGDPLENILKREFSYPLQELSNKKTPEGPWRYIWSNLPFKLKQAFYACFRDGQRPSVTDWIKHIDDYLYLVTKSPPAIVPTLFPSHLKPISNYARTKYGTEE